ncbi:MAG TPA: CDC27 family protein [Nitrosopumilaceae archaeon]|nr:CDC27 family protein [Nitrosopumilaceae archaeon]
MTGLFGRKSKDSTIKKISERKKELRKLVKQKQYENALKVGNEILEKNPYDQDVLFIVGGIYYMKNKLKTAISYFDRSLEIAEFDTELLLLKANAHFRLGELSQTKQCCEKIQEIDSKNKAVNELLEKIENTKND